MNTEQPITLTKLIGCNIKNLRTERAKRGENMFTQQWCADRIGASQSQWAAWEAGNNLPRDDFLAKIATLLEVHISELWKYTPPPTEAGGDDVTRDQLLAMCFDVQENLGRFGRHLLAGKGAEGYDGFESLSDSLEELERQLSDMTQHHTECRHFGSA